MSVAVPMPLQHDDALTQATYDAMTYVTDGRSSVNGCPAVATYFTTSTNTGEGAGDQGQGGAWPGLHD
jgi:hypothetical protein